VPCPQFRSRGLLSRSRTRRVRVRSRDPIEYGRGGEGSQCGLGGAWCQVPVFWLEVGTAGLLEVFLDPGDGCINYCGNNGSQRR
jgi:hypothetical protein